MCLLIEGPSELFIQHRSTGGSLLSQAQGIKGLNFLPCSATQLTHLLIILLPIQNHIQSTECQKEKGRLLKQYANLVTKVSLVFGWQKEELKLIS